MQLYARSADTANVDHHVTASADHHVTANKSFRPSRRCRTDLPVRSRHDRKRSSVTPFNFRITPQPSLQLLELCQSLQLLLNQAAAARAKRRPYNKKELEALWVRADADGDGGVDLQELLHELRADDIDLSKQPTAQIAGFMPPGASTQSAALAIQATQGSDGPTAPAAASQATVGPHRANAARKPSEEQSEEQAQARVAKEARAARKRRVHALVRQVPVILCILDAT